MRTLRSKFIFWICLLFILMGSLIFIPLSIILPQKISSQILERDVKIAQYLAREVERPLLRDDRLSLKFLLEERLADSKDGIYIFVRGRDGSIVSSTFKKGFPRALLKINPLSKGAPKYRINNPNQDLYSISRFFANGKRVYDIALPLLAGELGELHLGVSLESSKADIAEFSKINYYLAAVIFIGLGIGILIFTTLGLFLSYRIIKLRDFALRVGKGDLNSRVDIKTNDEIGILADSFNKMVEDLKEKIETIKRLSYLQERERIAMEFHDGLAQDLVNIIKRLELCERLFKFNPSKALVELETLKENTQGILNKARQVISDLHTTKDADFDLINNLNNYIKNYQKENNINIKLNISDFLYTIPAHKARSIFYIIAEALTNVRKHAQAKNVLIDLYKENKNLVVDIRDDGKGFDIDETELSSSGLGKLGLVSMRQRATSLGGRLLINSRLNQGTQVYVNIPLEER
ncbi:MAG: sensor histidine kinase [Candidatus Omnitrophica bacterium]|nr:sensor histidine kinase [Candidatus Omnitrophota bacterium]